MSKANIMWLNGKNKLIKCLRDLFLFKVILKFQNLDCFLIIIIMILSRDDQLVKIKRGGKDPMIVAKMMMRWDDDEDDAS